jgi:hypothetical protein
MTRALSLFVVALAAVLQGGCRADTYGGDAESYFEDSCSWKWRSPVEFSGKWKPHRRLAGDG